MKLRLTVFLAAVTAAVAGAVGPAASPAFACGAYWNIPIANACQYYDAGESHTEWEFGPGLSELMLASYNTYDSIRFIYTQADGSWTGGFTCTDSSGTCQVVFGNPDPKVGCYNHHTGQMFVNCHHEDYN